MILNQRLFSKSTKNSIPGILNSSAFTNESYIKRIYLFVIKEFELCLLILEEPFFRRSAMTEDNSLREQFNSDIERHFQRKCFGLSPLGIL